MMAELHSHSKGSYALCLIMIGTLVDSRHKGFVEALLSVVKKCACYEHTWRADMSTPTHILAGTKPEDDKHLSYAYRRTHTDTHTRILNFIRSVTGPGLRFCFPELNCTFELKCGAFSCCIFGCTSKNWVHFVIYLSHAFTFYISVI